MSNVLMCDSCGTVRSKTAARPEGWVSLRTLVALGHVVPETHPFHHERHLCSVECLQEFIQVAVDGGILPVDAEVVQLPSRGEVGRELGSVLDSGTGGGAGAMDGAGKADAEDAPDSSTSSRSPISMDEAPVVAQVPVSDSAAAAAPESHGAAAPVARLSDLIAQKLARGDGDRVDLREIAAKPAVKRRIK